MTAAEERDGIVECILSGSDRAKPGSVLFTQAMSSTTACRIVPCPWFQKVTTDVTRGRSAVPVPFAADAVAAYA